MNLKKIQRLEKKFERERGWENFKPSQVFTHLIEELGEIGSYVLFEEDYKKENLGHEKRENLEREFAQAFSLFLHLANYFHVDLEKAFLEELERMEKRFDTQK